MKRLYDKRKNALVFLREKATSDYWDAHWNTGLFEKKLFVKKYTNNFIINETKRYLPVRSRILEGGCGRGDKVYILHMNGYEAYGIDYAKETVRRVNNYAPDLNVSFGDIRDTAFNDNFFDGYWSLGVIEHFYNGYGEIINEMRRIIKPGGILFWTVPTMSPLRRLKVMLRIYDNYAESVESVEQFYQYALDLANVVKTFEKKGFKMVKHKYRSGIKGFKDEITPLKKPLQWVYNSNFIGAKFARKVLEPVLKKFAGHDSYFVFKNIN